MCDTFEKIKELNLSRDEVNRIGQALKNDEFRQLFSDYINEIQDPENRKLYEQEIVELERQRGVDVRFVKPQPGYVIKTSINGTQKCFINICMNDLVEKPTSIPEIRDGQRGLQWSLPHSITPIRDDFDNKKQHCRVVDIIFHPNTLYLAKKNKEFYQIVNNTAIDAVEKNHNVDLDRNNVKFPKLQYKGLPQSVIIRTPSTEHKPIEREGAEKELFDKIYKEVDDLSSSSSSRMRPKKSNKKPKTDDFTNFDKYTTPKYLIKYRNHIEFDEFVDNKFAKLNTTIPKELLIEVDLPLLKSSNDIILDVNEKTLELISEKPSKYKLNLTLPYHVNQDNGNAKFDKDLKKLLVLLPVKKQTNLIDINNHHDSGIDSDNQQLSPVITTTNNNNNVINHFLDNDIDYLLPEFSCHYFKSIIAFTLNVKNVDGKSLEKYITMDSVHLKFTNIGSSFYPINYAILIKFPITIVEEQINIDIWDNNVIVQIPLDCNNQQLQYYHYGLDQDHLQQKYLDEPSIINHIYENTIVEEPELESSPIEPTKESLSDDNNDDNKKSNAISILGTSYESSGDELSYNSFSPSRSKGILKNRRIVGRSVSESSLDDYVCCSSVDNEISTSFKKTVRFNDVIMRQLYRSNSSILGQKKKNQRKARNKKRAQERRHSESEASEIEDKQSTTTTTIDKIDVTNEIEDEIASISNDIFQMEIGS